MPFLEDWMARQASARWPDLAGTRAEVHLPLREPLVNDALEALVLPRVPALKRLSLRFLAGQHVEVVVAARALSILPALTVQLDLDPVVAIDPAPHVRLRLRRGSLAGVLGSLASGALPPGVRLTGGLIDVDLAALIGERDTLSLLPALRSARLETAPGLLWLHAELRV